MYEYLLYHIKMSISARGKKLLLTEQDLECNTIYFEIKKKKKEKLCVSILKQKRRETKFLYI